MRFDNSAACDICGQDANCVLEFESVPPIQNRFFSNYDEAVSFIKTDVGYYWCRFCGNLHIKKTKNAEFDSEYDNSQIYSPFSAAQYQAVADDIKKHLPDRDAAIVELGCGRGELINILGNEGYTRINGFDPAAPASNEVISNTYWSGSSAPGVLDLVIVRHTLEEIPAPFSFVSNIAEALKFGGLAYFEITNSDNLASPEGVFSLYPECSNLFSADSIKILLKKVGLHVFETGVINHGEWLRVWAKKSETPRDISLCTSNDSNALFPRFKNRLVAEEFYSNAESIFLKMRDVIPLLPRPVVLWGAAGRGGDFLAFLRLGIEDIAYVVDINPNKKGRYIPPFGHVIIGPDELSDFEKGTVIVASEKYVAEIKKNVSSDWLIYSLTDLLMF